MLIGYNIFFSIFRGNSVEIGVKGIEMNEMYSNVYNKIILRVIGMSCHKLFHTGNAHTSFTSE